jgi:hypothetical protein
MMMKLTVGNNSHPYQFCCGEIPNPKERKKINYPVSFLAGYYK